MSPKFVGVTDVILTEEQQRDLDTLAKFLRDQEPLGPEFQKVLDDHYWELLEDR